MFVTSFRLRLAIGRCLVWFTDEAIRERMEKARLLRLKDAETVGRAASVETAEA